MVLCALQTGFPCLLPSACHLHTHHEVHGPTRTDGPETRDSSQGPIAEVSVGLGEEAETLEQKVKQEKNQVIKTEPTSRAWGAKFALLKLQGKNSATESFWPGAAWMARS